MAKGDQARVHVDQDADHRETEMAFTGDQSEKTIVDANPNRIGEVQVDLGTPERATLVAVDSETGKQTIAIKNEQGAIEMEAATPQELKAEKKRNITLTELNDSIDRTLKAYSEASGREIPTISNAERIRMIIKARQADNPSTALIDLIKKHPDLSEKTEPEKTVDTGLKFVEITPDPIYSQGPAAVKKRLEDLQNELVALKRSNPEQSDRIHEELRRLNTVLPIVTEVDRINFNEQAADMIQETLDEITKKNKKESQKIKKKIGTRGKQILGTSGRINALNETLKQEEQDLIGLIELFEEGKTTGAAKSQIDRIKQERDKLQIKLKQLETDAAQLTAQSAALEKAGLSYDTLLPGIDSKLYNELVAQFDSNAEEAKNALESILKDQDTSKKVKDTLVEFQKDLKAGQLKRTELSDEEWNAIPDNKIASPSEINFSETTSPELRQQLLEAKRSRDLGPIDEEGPLPTKPFARQDLDATSPGSSADENIIDRVVAADRNPDTEDEVEFGEDHRTESEMESPMIIRPTSGEPTRVDRTPLRREASTTAFDSGTDMVIGDGAIPGEQDVEQLVAQPEAAAENIEDETNEYIDEYLEAEQIEFQKMLETFRNDPSRDLAKGLENMRARILKLEKNPEEVILENPDLIASVREAGGLKPEQIQRAVDALNVLLKEGEEILKDAKANAATPEKPEQEPEEEPVDTFDAKDVESRKALLMMAVNGYKTKEAAIYSLIAFGVPERVMKKIKTFEELDDLVEHPSFMSRMTGEADKIQEAMNRFIEDAVLDKANTARAKKGLGTVESVSNNSTAARNRKTPIHVRGENARIAENKPVTIEQKLPAEPTAPEEPQNSESVAQIENKPDVFEESDEDFLARAEAQNALDDANRPLAEQAPSLPKNRELGSNVNGIKFEFTQDANGTFILELPQAGANIELGQNEYIARQAMEYAKQYVKDDPEDLGKPEFIGTILDEAGKQFQTLEKQNQEYRKIVGEDAAGVEQIRIAFEAMTRNEKRTNGFPDTWSEILNPPKPSLLRRIFGNPAKDQKDLFAKIKEVTNKKNRFRNPGSVQQAPESEPEEEGEQPPVAKAA